MDRRYVLGGACAVLLLVSCVGRMAIPFSKGKSPRPKIIPRPTWVGSMPSGSYRTQSPWLISVLDTPTGYDPADEAGYLDRLVKEYMTDEGIGDVPVHYIINQHGRILAGRPVNGMGQLVYGDQFFRSEVPKDHHNYGKTINTASHILVLVLGDYETGPMPEKQETAMVDLIRYLIAEHRIPIVNVSGLRAYLPDCANPGKYLNEHLASAMLQLARSNR